MKDVCSVCVICVSLPPPGRFLLFARGERTQDRILVFGVSGVNLASGPGPPGGPPGGGPGGGPALSKACLSTEGGGGVRFWNLLLALT